jgi:leucyl/phenylalanyl-tRNA--protein transferase
MQPQTLITEPKPDSFDLEWLALVGIDPLPESAEPDAAVDNILADPFRNEFYYQLSFDTENTASLIRAGFLPMAMEVPSGAVVLTPKLHMFRCIIMFKNLHIERGLRRKSAPFTLTVDRNPVGVINGCREQHGESWLYLPLLRTLMNLHGSPLNGVSFHSFELWLNGDLAAGEIGYVTGGIYTSMSGFYRVPSAGSVQLAMTGSLLASLGFTCWDMGMEMDYKMKMGGTSIPAAEYITLLRSVRGRQAPLFPANEIRGIIKP